MRFRASGSPASRRRRAARLSLASEARRNGLSLARELVLRPTTVSQSSEEAKVRGRPRTLRSIEELSPPDVPRCNSFGSDLKSGLSLSHVVAEFLTVETGHGRLRKLTPCASEPFLQRLYIVIQSIAHRSPNLKVQRWQFM